MSTKPGWYPDPSGRYPKRWHDGVDWTASVLSNDGQQGFDQLPPAGAPSVASLPAAPSAAPRPASPAPPPPPGRSSAPAPAPSPWEPAQSWQSPPAASPAPPPASGGGSWQPGQPWQSTPSQTAQPYTPSTSGGVWAQQQQPVTTASLGLTPPPAVRATSSARTNPLVYALVALGIAGLVLSMFVLDWYSEGGASAGFRDFGKGSIPSSAEFLDKLAFWNYKWLGFVVAGVALLSVFVFVVARAGSHRLGHVLAAIGATIGAVLSTFAIVRLGRNVGQDPEILAWLLPGGYFVLLVAIVLGARNEPA